MHYYRREVLVSYSTNFSSFIRVNNGMSVVDDKKDIRSRYHIKPDLGNWTILERFLNEQLWKNLRDTLGQ